MSNHPSFTIELESLHMDMLKMAGMVEDSIEKIIVALKNQDINLAKSILQDDDNVDSMEKSIEKTCVSLIEKHHPKEKDLRMISSALKIITDLERIADHSSDIAEITIDMCGEKNLKSLLDIPKMAELARQMVRQAIDSYVRQDVDIAKKVCISDDEVDGLFEQIIIELKSLMKQNPETVDQSVHFLLIAKYLERMADHATNISEWVIFSQTGIHKNFNHEE